MTGMRNSEAADALDKAVAKHFPDDVAGAIKADSDMYDATVRLCANELDDATAIDSAMSLIRSDTDDQKFDWLVEKADSPAGWLYSAVKNRYW